MLRPILAAVALSAVASAAWAIDTPIPNGSFEDTSGGTGFTQTITNWSLSNADVIGVEAAGYTGVPGGTLPTSQQSGLFSSFGKFIGSAPNNVFVLIDNLGGTGTVVLRSGAVGTNFKVTDRFLQFRYAYLSNDPASAASHDQFLVRVDFFATATSTTVVSTTGNLLVADRGTLNDTNAGVSPFGGAANNSAFTFNNAAGNLNLINISVENAFTLNQFARVSFIVNNNGPAAGVNNNGLGVSGVVLDLVVLNPEPSAIALFAAGIAGLGGLAWRRRSCARQQAKKPAGS
jgi:hypothetical protein